MVTPPFPWAKALSFARFDFSFSRSFSNFFFSLCTASSFSLYSDIWLSLSSMSVSD